MSTMLKTIPLCQLKPSKANVRRTDRHADIEQMAASIQSSGLLENLVVHPQSGDTYEVVAGGRRLAALKLLAKRRKIDRRHGVPCLVLKDAVQAAEASLAENFVRVPLHPADQFEAFAGLVDKGLSADEIGARFGVTPTFVLQRLKLASVSPRLIGEYRTGALTLEQLTAFTLNEDHAAQEAVWFDNPYAEMPPHLIRRLLTVAQVDGSDRRARFVGTTAYEAAGGIIVRDLFDTQDEGYFSDSQLLDRLAAEKLEQAAQAVRKEGWQWVEVHADADYAMLSAFGRAQPAAVLLGKKEEARLSRLGERYDALVSELETKLSRLHRRNSTGFRPRSKASRRRNWCGPMKSWGGLVRSSPSIRTARSTSSEGSSGQIATQRQAKAHRA